MAGPLIWPQAELVCTCRSLVPILSTYVFGVDEVASTAEAGSGEGSWWHGGKTLCDSLHGPLGLSAIYHARAH